MSLREFTGLNGKNIKVAFAVLADAKRTKVPKIPVWGKDHLRQMRRRGQAKMQTAHGSLDRLQVSWATQGKDAGKVGT